jgi:hypothetical protein
MNYGFNSNVEVGKRVFHLQTEAKQRPATAIESSVFFGGSVQYQERQPIEEQLADADLDQRLRRQHARVLLQLRTGELRGRGRRLALDASTAPDNGGLRVRLIVRLEGQPTTGANIECAWVQGNSEPDLWEGVTDNEGVAEVALPGNDSDLLLAVRAEYGLSVVTRKFQIQLRQVVASS